MIEVEVETLAQLREALATDADRIMLDDFSLDDMREAVAAARRATGASGRSSRRRAASSRDTLRAVAATGVDFVSIGAITKHVRAIDFSMRFA